MEALACGRTCLMAAMLALGSAAPIHLRSTTASSSSAAQSAGSLAPDVDAKVAWRHAVEEMFTGFYAERGFTRGIDSDTKKDDQEDAQTAGPPHLQVPEKELKSLMQELSARCEEQFRAIVHGRAPPIHEFGTPSAGSSAADCGTLDGTLCSTSASVTQQQDTQARSMYSTSNVTGNGCIPRSCTDRDDLEVLATFMQGKAKGAIPGANTHIKLHVDCSKAGGSVVEVGTSLSAADHATLRSRSATEHKAEHMAERKEEQHEEHPPKVKVKSSAVERLPAVLVLLGLASLGLEF